MQYNKGAKIGRKFGDGKQWYPNLTSAIMNRQLQKGSTISKSLPEMLAYVSVVKARYERMFGTANNGLQKTPKDGEEN